MLAFVTAALLFTAPDAGTADAAEDAPPSGFEVVIPEKMIEDLLASASPFDRDMKQTVSVLGMSQDVRFTVRLRNPKVKVTPSGVHVTLDYNVGSAAGLGASGTARPRLELKPDEKSGDLIAKLVDATLTSTGVSLPLDQVVDPISLPAAASGPLSLGGKNIEASGRAEKVVLENGRVRVLGSWSFKPARKDKKP